MNTSIFDTTDPNTLGVDVGDLSPFETRLIQAMRAHPDRNEMWVSRGNPTKSHKKLIAMYVRFFEICNQYEIEYWLEYGSLLGYIRHRSINPWEWDMDIGCTPENFQKLVEVAEIVNATDKEFGFQFYHDPDYAVPGFSFYLREDPDCLCDITEYCIDEEKNELYCAVKEWNYPRYKKDMVFPLRKVLMLGELTYVPKDAEGILSKVESILGQCTGKSGEINLNKISYLQYDPVPFLLTKIFNPESAEKLVQYPFWNVPEAATVAEGMKEFASQGLPFIVRNCDSFKFNYDAFKQSCIDDKTTTFGYDSKLNVIENLSVLDCLNDWEKGELGINFVDSPMPSAVDDDSIEPSLAEFGMVKENIMMVLSNKNAYTRFHQDPFDENMGGGWMWLKEGAKLWNLIDFDNCDNVFDSVKGEFTDYSTADLLYLNKHELWGKMYHGWIEGGDFLYFPTGMTHRVKTYKQSCGIGGYCVDEPKERRERILEWYDKFGLDNKLGIWTAEWYEPKKKLYEKVKDSKKVNNVVAAGDKTNSVTAKV